MGQTTIKRQDFSAAGEYGAIEWEQKTLTADDTYEDCVDFRNDNQDYILLIRPVGANGSVKLSWTGDPYGPDVSKEIAIDEDDIKILTQMGLPLGSTPVIQGKLATVTGNTLDFALLKIKEAH